MRLKFKKSRLKHICYGHRRAPDGRPASGRQCRCGRGSSAAQTQPTTRHLAEIRRAQANKHHVETADEVEPGWFDGWSVGLRGSVDPDWVTARSEEDSGTRRDPHSTLSLGGSARVTGRAPIFELPF